MVSDDARGGFARNGKQPQWPFLEAVGGALRTVWGKYPAGTFREEALAGVFGAVSGSSGIDPDRGSRNFCGFRQRGERSGDLCGAFYERGAGDGPA